MGGRADLRASLPEDLELPERYELVRRIATGGMASVWCAEDRILGRRVAIKLLSERYAYDEMAVRRFKREARVAARLSGHQNIVTIFDVGEAARTPDEEDAPGRAFIVMEYLAGGTVADALRVGAMERQAIEWLRETAAALDYAHGQGVVHRDIKPVNLLLDCDRVVHVADFGIARIGTDESITHTGLVLGTAAYIAPEQALGHPATEASDRYSLAVTAFELLVGERPFASTQLAAQARQHVEDEPPAASTRNQRLPSEVDEVLARGMAKRPEDRWPTAGAFAEALAGALSQPATAMTRAFGAVPPPPRKRAPATAAGAAAAATGSGPERVARGSGVKSPGRLLALAALAAAMLAVVMVATGRTGGGSSVRQSASAHRTTAAATTPTPAAAKPAPTKAPPPQAPAATSTTSTQATATAAAATTPAPTSDTLEAQGHSLMGAGNYQAAIPVLRQALAAAAPGSLTYAYAMYDLGHSLRLAGDPSAAAQILWKRMQIPNQTGVVRSELQAALRALGQRAQSTGGGAPTATTPPGHAGDQGKANGQGHGGGNGD